MSTTRNFQSLISDYFYAGIFQVINILSPFLILYFFLPIIGKTLYANIFVITAIGSYFKILYDFGFDYFASKRVSNESNNNQKEIVLSGIISAKVILSTILFIPQIVISVLLIENKNFYFVITYSIYMIFMALIPNWYFLATQNFKYMAIINIVGIVSILLSSAFLIQTSESWFHYSTSFLIGSVTQLIVASFALSKEKIRLRFILNFNLGKKYLKTSRQIFQFNFISNIYVSSSVIFLQLFKVPSELITDFGIAEKIVRGVRQIFTPINRITYPRFLKFRKNNNQLFKKYLIRYASAILILGSLLSFIVYLSTDIIFKLLNYPSNNETLLVIYILLPILSVGSVGGFLCLNKFIVEGKEKLLFYIMIFVSLSFIVASVLLIPLYSIIGAAVSIIIAELILLGFVSFKK